MGLRQQIEKDVLALEAKMRRIRDHGLYGLGEEVIELLETYRREL